jgi:hypothetical protein
MAGRPWSGGTGGRVQLPCYPPRGPLKTASVELKTYPRVDLRFEGDLLIPEKPLLEADDFPSALYVQDRCGQVCVYRLSA